MIRISLHSSAEKLKIRPVELDDTDICALAELMAQWDDLKEELPKEHIEERIIDVKTTRNAEILVAENEDGALVGYAHISEVISLEKNPFVELRAILVDENLRKKNIGRKLVSAAEEWARKKGFKQIIVSPRIQNEKIHEFCKHLEYEESERTCVFPKSI
ncbi:MAG: GNAT family N-acetyltransferase [Fibrobacterota bacterium]